MSSSTQPDYRNSALDPDLLDRPFKVQTSWHVITGSSCSGKTTLINQLAERGFQTVPEAGLLFSVRERSRGRSINEIREDPAVITPEIYKIMVENELKSQEKVVLFFDRALGDAPAFYRTAGLDPNSIVQDCFLHRYASVFMLHRFPYQKAGVRSADDDTAAYLESWIASDYMALGYDIIWVPVLPPEERLAFVLDKISEEEF